MAELNPPLGTTTPEIFLDNVKRADELVNGPAGTVNDRAGEPLDTWRQMMAKNDQIRQNIIPLSKQYATLAAAQADIVNIPVNSTTYVRSPDGSALADEYMNVAGTLTATGRRMPSQAYVDGMQGDIDSLNQMRIALSDSLSDTWRDDRDDKTEVVLVADNALRKLVKLNIEKQKLVVFGNEVPRQGEVDEAREAGSETWSYNGSDADRIILLADSAGRIVRELRLSEQAEYLFGKKVGTGGDASYIPPQYWPEFVDCRAYGQSLSISLNAGAGILTPVTNAFMFDTGIVTYNKTLTSLVTVFQRKNGHDRRCKKANVLAIALRLGRVVQVAKKLLSGTADVIRKRDLLAALLSPFLDDVRRHNILTFSRCPGANGGANVVVLCHYRLISLYQGVGVNSGILLKGKCLHGYTLYSCGKPSVGFG